MKIKELIEQLKQYPEDVEVWIDIENLWRDGTRCMYQDIVAGIEPYSDIKNGIKLKSRAEVREKIKTEMGEIMSNLDISSLTKLRNLFTQNNIHDIIKKIKILGI